MIRSLIQLLVETLKARGCTQKDLAARWHTIAARRGHPYEFSTVVTQFSRLRNRDATAIDFFLTGGRTEITAETFELPVVTLLSTVGILGGRSGGEQ